MDYDDKDKIITKTGLRRRRMKENKYDEKRFFEKYKKFPRSLLGLQGAGEWQELEKMLPHFTGKKVLDVGCGFGWHCRYAAEKGAKEVLGIDISENMLGKAKELTWHPQVVYKQMAMEDMDFSEKSFDVVLSSLAFHYAFNFETLCEKVFSFLDENGIFVFSVEHPIFTAQGKQDWIYNQQGEPLYWPVDDYFNEGKREAVFLKEKIVKYHKTITTYINGLLNAGFTLKKLVEPMPPKEMIETNKQMIHELRRPMMLLIKAEKICK